VYARVLSENFRARPLVAEGGEETRAYKHRIVLINEDCGRAPITCRPHPHSQADPNNQARRPLSAILALPPPSSPAPENLPPSRPRVIPSIENEKVDSFQRREVTTMVRDRDGGSGVKQ
jgi:hypothetical protein